MGELLIVIGYALFMVGMIIWFECDRRGLK